MNFEISVCSINRNSIDIFIFSIPNGKPSSINKNSQKEAANIDGKDILDESTRSGKIKNQNPNLNFVFF